MKKIVLFLIFIKSPLFAEISYYFSNPLAQTLKPFDNSVSISNEEWLLKVIKLNCLEIRLLYNKGQWREIHYTYNLNPYTKEEITFNRLSEKKSRVWQHNKLMEEKVEKNGKVIYQLSFKGRSQTYRPDGRVRSIDLAGTTYRFNQDNSLVTLSPEQLLKWQWTSQNIEKTVLTKDGRYQEGESLSLNKNGTLHRILKTRKGYQDYLYSPEARLLAQQISQAGTILNKDNWRYDKQGRLLYWRHEEKGKMQEYFYEWDKDELKREILKDQTKVVQITNYSAQEKTIQRFNSEGVKIGEFTLKREL